MPTAVIVCAVTIGSIPPVLQGTERAQSLLQVSKRYRDHFVGRLLSSCFLELICPTGRIYDYGLRWYEHTKLRRSQVGLHSQAVGGLTQAEQLLPVHQHPEIASERDCQTDSAGVFFFRFSWLICSSHRGTTTAVIVLQNLH